MRSKITILATLLLAFLVITRCQPPGEMFEGAICIQNITTVDPTDGPREAQTVIIKDGKILRISPTAELRLSSKNQIVDGTGKFLIPGLWDAHVHFAYIEALAPRMFDLFLLYGITSVRDTGGEIMFVKKWKDAALANPTDAPRVMIAGPLLDGMPNVYDGSDPGHPPLSIGSGSVEALETLIHKLDSIGVDFLKAYEMLTPEQYYKLMEMAKRLGYKVTGHVPLSMDVIGASNAGLNSMEHMRNLEISCASNAEELLIQRHAMLKKGKNLPGGELRSSIHAAQREVAVNNYNEKKADEIIQVLLKNQTWQIPTLTLNTSQARPPYTRPEWQESFEYLPDTIRNQWKSYLEASSKEPASPFRQAYSTWMMNMAGKIHKAGVPMMAGTDTPIAFLTPGLSLHEELVSLVEAGLSTQEALKAATINPAIYFGIENELGSIRETQWADLLILSANPLEDIRNTQRIDAVIKQGKFFGKSELDSIKSRLR
ncbi:MAG: amidohydrolase family protein [Cyclobacteriaceae bacterium]|nr:amidohydrolase family protein [Cyclobacteriaceae bacterium]